MKFDKPITRRESIRRLLRWSGCVTLAGAVRWPSFTVPDAWATTAQKGFIIEGRGQTDGFSVKELTKKVFEAAGGIQQFVSRGDVVHNGHPMETPSQNSRIGKKYGSDFHFLAADVSASKKLVVDGMDPRRPWPPHAKLRSIKPTSYAADKTVREIRLTLDGDMHRYLWFLNKKPLSESDSIRIREGEVARFIMINRTMMHHPMHLHGHFFRVVNGQGDHAPLKHTVDVAPMSTTVIKFDANEVGDWFFHCHLLYHMKSGMARMIHYEDFSINPQLEAILKPKIFSVWVTVVPKVVIVGAKICAKAYNF